MSQASPRRPSAAVVEGAAPPAAKRRKLRKGTVSCCECKRRKTRCTFASPTSAVCDGCRSRRTPCTSQEFADDDAAAAAVTTKPKTDDVRLRRVESLVEQLAQKQQQQQQQQRSIKAPVAEPLGVVDDGPDGPDDVSQALLAAWPEEHDLAIILRAPTSLATLLHGLVCAPYARLVPTGDDDDEEEAWPRRMLRRPPTRGAHPVLIARRLLLLATLLRGVPDDDDDDAAAAGRFAGLRTPHRTHRDRAFEAATRLVTRRDDLAAGSVDAVECVMMEAMYLNNTGQLRRAWLANRRALSAAQMLGLHHRGDGGGNARPPPPVLEPETRVRVDPAYMWFRLVCSDRYLSLMLGLPQAVRDDAAFASPAALAACAGVERLERVCTVACGLVIERNRAERTDRAATDRVDRMLQDATALMPPAWWRETPDAAALAAADDDARAFDETLRLMTHLALRHVLVQLHLPYLLLPPTTTTAAGARSDYSKMVAAGACRSIVSQFAAFRDAVPAGTSYCRGVDFIAFVASAVLCLAHIEARRPPPPDDAGGAVQSLRHQRPGDRALLERVLASMAATAQATRDAIAQRACAILRPLLAIEDHAARGASYHASASEGPGAPDDPAVTTAAETPDRLDIEIPYFGTVKVERRPVASHSPRSAPPQGPVVQTAGLDPVALLSPGPRGPRAGPGANMLPAGDAWQSVPPYPPATEPSRNLGPEDWDLFPGLSADDDDWALQGVDMALFNNLSYGSSGLHDAGPQADAG